MSDEPTTKPARLSKVQEIVQRRRSTQIIWRLVVTVVGFAVLAAGLAMLVLPGPGWAVIFVGLAILASEYTWAHRLLSKARNYAERLAERAMDPRHRRRNQLVVVVVGVTVALAAVLYVRAYGWTIDGPREWF